MTLARTAQKRDANETPIVHVFEAMGCSVDRIPGGDGRMDLLVGDEWQGHRYDFKVEVKMPGEPLRDTQKKYHARWKGAPIFIVHTEGEAIELLSHLRKTVKSRGQNLEIFQALARFVQPS